MLVFARSFLNDNSLETIFLNFLHGEHNPRFPFLKQPFVSNNSVVFRYCLLYNNYMSPAPIGSLADFKMRLGCK